jgi:choline dehydrogenase-like flavoprotein
MESVDIAIVGSGFGGAITAMRLAEECAVRGLRARIRILEKGHDYFNLDPNTVWRYRNAQGNGFKQTMKLDYYAQMLNIWTDLESVAAGAVDPNRFPTFSIMGGRAVGGGSLVYLGVSLRAATDVFEQRWEAGRRLWPSMYTRAHLNPYYARAEGELKVARMKWSTSQGVPLWQTCTKRDHVFATGCLKAGFTAEPLKIALQNDTSDGWWHTGQRFPGRQHLPLNYLARAKQLGVEIHSGCSVSRIAPDGRGYVIDYRDARSGGERKTLACKILVVAAGAVGSTALLLRSEHAFRGDRELSDHLGRHVSGNGDFTASGIVGPQYRVEGHKGKPMSSFSPSFWADSKFILVPFFVSPMPFAFGQPAAMAYPKNPAATGRRSTEPATRLWGGAYKELFKSFGPRLLTMVCLGLDRCEGEVKKVPTLTGTSISVEWKRTHPDTEAMWTKATQAMRKIMNALDGELLTDAYRHRGHVISMHPLGGCRMAETRQRGVVDDKGEVFGNPNLFVIDGAIIPTSLGVNPSLTICAVAESIADRIAPSLGERLA